MLTIKIHFLNARCLQSKTAIALKINKFKHCNLSIDVRINEKKFLIYNNLFIYWKLCETFTFGQNLFSEYHENGFENLFYKLH